MKVRVILSCLSTLFGQRVEFERGYVSKLWNNITDLGCRGTQCNVVNINCIIGNIR